LIWGRVPSGPLDPKPAIPHNREHLIGELHYLQFKTNPETLRAAPDQQSIPQYESITYWQNTSGQTMFIKRTQFFMGYDGVDGLYDSFALLGRKSDGMYIMFRSWDHYAPASSADSKNPQDVFALGDWVSLAPVIRSFSRRSRSDTATNLKTALSA
jgi:hypothetical protein